jgi:arylsulfatase A-like enzyme
VPRAAPSSVRRPISASPPGWRRLEWLVPLGLTAQLLVTAVRATSAVLAPHVLAALALLYGLLALSLFLGARFAMRAAPAAGVLACLAVALLPVAQLRLTGRLQHPLVLAASALALAALLHGCLCACAPRRPFHGGHDGRSGLRARWAACRDLAGATLALVALAGLAVSGLRLSAELRWQLLARDRLLGAPLARLVAPPTDAVRDALWTRRGRLAEPAEYASLAALPAPAPGGAGARGPHVVLVMLDTLRADALAAYGDDPRVMPRLNALAERAAVFTDVHANASWTRASCASIFTGLLPEEHGAVRFHERLADAWVTLPEELATRGYQTAAFVANWVQVGRVTGFAQGFEHFAELGSGAEILAAAGAEADERAVRGAYARASELNAAAHAWLTSDARDPYRPLFLYLHYLDPHAPYREDPEPGTLGDPHQRRRGLYRQQLRYLDRELAAMLATLDEVLTGPRVVVFTSDHGEEFWEHDALGHGHALYRELVWVPLVVDVSGGPGGSRHAGAGQARIDAPLESRDLFRLVQDLAADPALDLGAWSGAHARPVRYASQYLDHSAGGHVRATGMRRVDAGARTLIWSARGATLELYDRARDPGELENRADRERGRTRALAAALEHAVRFWCAPTRVERSADELSFLDALGYAGGP